MRYQITHRVTLVGAFTNVVLAIAKIVFGWLGQSQALIADGLHSFSDLLSDGLVLLGARFGGQQADEDHPYGHGRIETLATVAMGLLLLLVAGGIVWDSIERLMVPLEIHPPSWLALSIALVSILSKEALYHYTRHAANQINSQLLHANAWHHRSDALSSIVVFISIGGSMAGIFWLDIAGAIIVAMMIGHIGWLLVWRNIQELIDTSVSPEQVSNIQQIIREVPGVKSLHQLRTRQMGGAILADVHILVACDLTVSEGHQISEVVHQTLLKASHDICDVIVHIDPEDDEEQPRNSDLPLRDTVLTQLQQKWQHIPAAKHIHHINLHYLAGKISMDIHLSADIVENFAQARHIAEQFSSSAKDLVYIKQIRVYIDPYPSLSDNK